MASRSTAALWDPARDKGRDRLLFIARPHREVSDAIEALPDVRDLIDRHRGDLFARENWHQSVSDRYIDIPTVREALLQAGGQMTAPAFTMTLDRLHSALNHRGRFQWDVRSRLRNDELKALVAVVNAAIAASGLPTGGGHSPHITLSYGTGTALTGTTAMTPIDWLVDAIELVVGGGSPYRYTTLARWPLAPTIPRLVQSALF